MQQATASSPPVCSTATQRKPREQVFDLLRGEHRHLKQAFRDIGRMGDAAPYDVDLVARTCAALEAHIRLEEELFFPIVCTRWRAAPLVDAAQLRYRGIKQLVGELKRMPAHDPLFNARFRVLSGYMRLQMREEENTLFKVLAHVDLHWQALFDALRRRQAELVIEYCLALRRGPRRVIYPPSIPTPARSAT